MRFGTIGYDQDLMTTGTSSYCLYCMTDHPVYYLVTKNDEHRHLVYKCPKVGVKFLPMVEGLKVPTVYSKQWHKAQQTLKQQTLL